MRGCLGSQRKERQGNLRGPPLHFIAEETEVDGFPGAQGLRLALVQVKRTMPYLLPAFPLQVQILGSWHIKTSIKVTLPKSSFFLRTVFSHSPSAKTRQPPFISTHLVPCHRDPRERHMASCWHYRTQVYAGLLGSHCHLQTGVELFQSSVIDL